MSSPSAATAIVILLLLTLTSLAATAPSPPPHCDPSLFPDPRSLRSDKLTVLLSGFSPHRAPLLRRIALHYSSHPSVASVLLLWSNPNETLTLGGGLPPSVAVLRLPSPSLNLRFLPRPQILTRAAAIADDDVLPDSASLSFALRVWRAHPRRLVGFFPRSHTLDISSGPASWAYAVHPDRYSILLTKLLLLDSAYLWRYSCGGGAAMAAARAAVDRRRNCEDILMNIVAAKASGAGPLLVEGRRLRDYGDPRNDGEQGGREDPARFRGGLSAVAGHRKRRGECIGEFHRLLGEMPLRYSYGKLVMEVREQGLCRKRGKLVPCDRQL